MLPRVLVVFFVTSSECHYDIAKSCLIRLYLILLHSSSASTWSYSVQEGIAQLTLLITKLTG